MFERATCEHNYLPSEFHVDFSIDLRETKHFSTRTLFILEMHTVYIFTIMMYGLPLYCNGV